LFQARVIDSKVSDITVAAGGSITLTSTQLIPSGTGAGDFNGFQLVEAAPEPSETMMLIGGLVLLASAYQRRKSFEKKR